VSTLFNAPVHVKHLTELFESLSFDEVADFVVCQVADSTNLNPKIAKDLGYPHVGCRDHCLNNGGKDMERTHLISVHLSIQFMMYTPLSLVATNCQQTWPMLNQLPLLV
jgi:hypothetical protein